MSEWTQERHETAKARCEAATSGPWVLSPPLCGPDGQGVYQLSSGGPICDVGDPYPRGENRPQENMEFIAEARTDLPDALAEIERLQTELAWATREVYTPGTDGGPDEWTPADHEEPEPPRPSGLAAWTREL